MSGEESWASELRHLVDGDDVAVQAFWDEYGSRLQALAARHLSPRLQLREAPEDVAQSVCRTFFRRAQDGQFRLDDRGSLWRLLCAITMTKTREKARYHGRAKRSWKREQRLAVNTDGDGGAWLLQGDAADPAEIVALADQLDVLAAQLDDEQCTVLRMKLDGRDHEEIAATLSCSERTVRRILERLKTRLRNVLEDSILGQDQH